jgi:DNA-binding MarR family transcriptional regulator
MTVTNPETLSSRPAPRFPEELVASTAFLLKRLGFLAKEQALTAYEPTGLGPYHHAILIALDEGAPETQGAIADALGYDRGQLVGLLDELEEQGLVERRRDPSDRRRHLVRLTPEGRRALGRLRTLARRLENDLVTPLDEHEREQLHALLQRLAEHHLPRCSRIVPVRAGAAETPSAIAKRRPGRSSALRASR